MVVNQRTNNVGGRERIQTEADPESLRTKLKISDPQIEAGPVTLRLEV